MLQAYKLVFVFEKNDTLTTIVSVINNTTLFI